MNISKKSQYGLRAMVLLAKSYKLKQIISTKEISQKEGVPFDFLEKILSNLEKAKLVKGKKGIGGGYVLAKNLNKITAKDIFKTLENTTAVNCSFCGKSKKCLAKNVWRKIDIAIDKTLKSITLADLIK
jgi:Rrf2 family protein